MMNNILSDLYYGDLTPGEIGFKRDSEYGRTTAKMHDAEEKLRAALSADILPLLDSFTEAQMHMDVIAVKESYIEGFKTGARIMLAVLDDSHGDLLPIGEKE